MVSHTSQSSRVRSRVAHTNQFPQDVKCGKPLYYAIMSMKSWADRSFTRLVSPKSWHSSRSIFSPISLFQSFTIL
jgi:hypothetical protein